MHNEKPLWELAGMAMRTFRDLPWPEKRKIILRHKGIGILPACFDCGKGWHQMKEDAFQKTMPDKYKHTQFGRLIWLWELDEAQKDRSKW